jgi:hypothetical protein
MMLDEQATLYSHQPDKIVILRQWISVFLSDQCHDVLTLVKSPAANDDQVETSNG